jgi:uncharacterized cupin superfamily protein
MQNRSNLEAHVLEVGTRAEDDTTYYSDIDMVAPAGHVPNGFFYSDRLS